MHGKRRLERMISPSRPVPRPRTTDTFSTHQRRARRDETGQLRAVYALRRGCRVGGGQMVTRWSGP